MEVAEVVDPVVEKLDKWLEAFVDHLPNIALAIVIIVGTLLIGRLIRPLANKYMQKWGTDQTISSFLSRLLFIVIVVLGFMLALSVLELSKTVTSILAGLGIIGLALGFAFQDTAANFMSGIYITFKQPYAIGDVIETGDTMGTVLDINMRVTKIQSFDGPIIYVPNRFLFEEKFTNFTEAGKRRVRIGCGVSYGDDLEKVERVTLEAMESVEGRLPNEDITVFWTEFGDSSINFTVNIWFTYTTSQKAFIGVRNQAIKKLKAAFDANDITIPFPIRTLDYDIKGGEKLSSQLSAVQGENGAGR